MRSKAILAAAFDLWRIKGFQQLTMNDLAHQVGLAKGTLYLYFATKEDLFLAMLEERFWAWLEQVERALLRGPKNDPGAVAAAFVETLGVEPDLSPLLLLLEPVLEHNVDHQSVLEFKRRMLGAMLRVARAIESCLPRLSGRGMETLIRIRAYMTGIQQMVSSPPSVVAAIAIDSDLSVFELDLTHELREGFLALLGGIGSITESAKVQPKAASSEATREAVEVKRTTVIDDSPWQRRF